MKKKSIIAVCILIVGLLGGCGKKFDAAAYTKALLDTSYKNDSTDFLSMNIGTTEEATAIYEQELDAEADAMFAAAGSMTDEQIQEYRQVFADILAGAKYTVSETEKQDDGSYIVKISYEQMQIFAPASEAYQVGYTDFANHGFEAASNGEFLTTDEKKVVLVDLYIDCFIDALSNVTYAEPETATIKIELVNDEYIPNESDLANLKTILFDIGANRNELTFDIPFDAAAYTKAMLDISYKNDPTDFLSMELGTAEEAAALYEQDLDAEVDAMLASANDNISEEQAQEFRQVFADILAEAKYTVDGAEKQEDGSFVVTITYEKMQIFGPAMEQYMEGINTLAAEIKASGNVPSDDEIMETIVNMLKDSFVDALPNATYAESATTTIRIELNNDEYSFDENDIYPLETFLFDTESA